MEGKPNYLSGSSTGASLFPALPGQASNKDGFPSLARLELNTCRGV
jgi:hypothetical protein